MSRDTARTDDVLGPIFSELSLRFPRGDAFHELVLHLMYEAFVRGEQSAWAPYISLLPTTAEMGFPLFYSPAQLDALQNSVVVPHVLRTRQTLVRRWQSIKSAVLQQWPDTFVLSAFNLHNYVWAAAVLDSRSIWWAGERHLVPLLDLINCAQGPDPTVVHATKQNGM